MHDRICDGQRESPIVLRGFAFPQRQQTLGFSIDFDFVGRDEKDTMSSVNNNNKI